MSDQRLKIAVFIDFDNVEIGVKTTLGRQFDVGAVLEAVKERGEIITKIAYGDWKRAGDHGRTMAQHAVRMVQRVMTPGGDKNGADINLALDALEMAFTHDHINAFVIVGGDSDFITLVEKLKQYDKKVFVIGGRSFTSQVMQKNCTEFIAYENVSSGGGPPLDRQRVAARPERGRSSASGAPLDQALPLVQRALKVLADREVSPQLGLLKSTLLQLDSSFSERDYGAGTFRDFAEKLEQRGFVTLKHSGRTTLVELASQGENGAAPDTAPAAPREAEGPPDARLEAAVVEAVPSSRPSAAPSELSLADGVALVRAVLAEATTPPRWPMYLRQMKQFIRNARPDFDERQYGSLQDLLRACQKAGLVRLERDRQGGLRAFAGASRPTSVPHGWAVGAEVPGGMESDIDTEAEADAEAAAEAAGNGPEPGPAEMVGAPEPVVDARIVEAVDIGPEIEEPIELPARRRPRSRKADAGAPASDGPSNKPKRTTTRARGGARSKDGDTRSRSRSTKPRATKG